MYEFAYNDVVEDSHQTLRARERAGQRVDQLDPRRQLVARELPPRMAQ